MIQFTEPSPFRFNPWKHHLGWICNELKDLEKIQHKEVIQKEFLKHINLLNSNQIDIYTGTLHPMEIIDEIKGEIKEEWYQSRINFTQCLKPNEYRIVKISDDSKWILREGLEDNKFIHIHPARLTPFSIRVYGNSLKTALLYKFLFKNKPPVLVDVNFIRRTYLNLSPVKDLKTCKRISDILSLINLYL